MWPGTTLPGIFIFDTEDGTISAWNAQANLGSAVIAVDHSALSANYKGLAFGTNSTGNHLYATNFYSGKSRSLTTSSLRWRCQAGSWINASRPALRRSASRISMVICG